MKLNDMPLKSSIIEFEDKYLIRDYLSGRDEPDRESIRCQIPELDLGEKVILNAWGSWEIRYYKDYRRRLGIYSINSKKDQENVHYVLRREKEFYENELVHALLSGDFMDITENTKDLKYLPLDRFGSFIFRLV